MRCCLVPSDVSDVRYEEPSGGVERTMSKGFQAGLTFGGLLMVGSFVVAGGGHGSYLPLALTGAPLSWVPGAGIVAPMLLWGTLGHLVASGNRAFAILLLSGHTLAVLACLQLGNPYEPGAQQWEYFARTQRLAPVPLWATLGLYIVGLAAAWRLLTSRYVWELIEDSPQ